MSFHKDQIDDDNHALTARTYDDITARDADSTFNTDSDNVNKIVRVDSPLAYYVLSSISPTWATFMQTDIVTGFTINFDANDALFPSSDPAVANSRNSHPILSFDDTVAEGVIFNDGIPNAYQDEDISVNIDWIAATATSGGVTWGIEIEANAAGGNDIDSDSFAAQQTGNDDTNATSGVITTTTITLTQAQADSIAANDAFRLRLQRVTGDGDDDMLGDAQVLKVSMSV